MLSNIIIGTVAVAMEVLNSNCSRYGPEPVFHYAICGKEVCRDLWLATLGISIARFYRVRSLFLEGKTSIDQSGQKRGLSLKSNEAVAWMEHYFER